MSTVQSFLLTIASALGDARPGSEFRRYPLDDMLAAYNEGLCFIAGLRRDLFTRMVVMKLTPGLTQDAKCCGCLDVTGVMAQVDAAGNTIKDLTEATAISGQTSRWYRAPCRETVAGAVPVIQGVTFETGLTGVFSVQPPVPVGVDMWAKVKCVAPPKALTTADLLGGVDSTGAPVPPASTAWCTFLPALRSYILFRMLGGDRHAVGAANDAARELKMVYDYLGLQYKFEQALNKE